MINAYYIERTPVNKAGASRPGYLTSENRWREFDVNETQTVDLLPALFTSADDAHTWIIRNAIRTYCYFVRDCKVNIFTLSEGLYKNVTEEKNYCRIIAPGSFYDDLR